MNQFLRPIIVSLLLFTGLFGVVYPLGATLLLQNVFPQQAAGSLIKEGNITHGSMLIGQAFSKPEYFWGRLSATSNVPYNAASSGGSNFSVGNPALKKAAALRIAALREADPANSTPIPIDLITASASGLDPHISVEAALYQLPRVAKMRNHTTEEITKLLHDCTETRQFTVLGEARVNILQLNLALDSKLTH